MAQHGGTLSPGDEWSGPGPPLAATSRRRWLVGLLDTVILLYAFALGMVLLIGGVDLGWVSATTAAKPALVLMIVVPLRVVIGGRSWLTRAAQPVAQYLRPLWAAATARLWVSAAVRDVAFAILVTQLPVFVIAFLVNLLFPFRYLRPFEMPFRWEKFVEPFAAWDSGWYFDIARRGYYYNPDGQSSVAFFPLYPLVMRAVAFPFGGSERALWMAGILVSCASFAGALLVLHRLTERVLQDREAARRAVLYCAIFPFSFFLSRIYAEALFLLLTLLAASGAYEARWGRAGLWGGLATLTRPNGVLIGVPLALMALGGRPSLRETVRRMAWLAPVALALLGYSLYVQALGGHPLAWLSAQAHWGYSLGHPPWEQLLKMLHRLEKYGFYDYFFVSTMAPFRLFHGAVALLCLLLAPAVFKGLGPAWGTYVVLSLFLPLSGNALEGVGRYAAVLFPVFITLAAVQSHRFHEAMLVVCSLFLAFLVSLFATGHPVY